mmetsp:Transcript_14385/g.19698  ORF Transcript_14385/g.19698 Transcript_14385/m.19698 type:complete len:159 (+) Transcript_14385:344-820(+)
MESGPAKALNLLNGLFVTASGQKIKMISERNVAMDLAALEILKHAPMEVLLVVIQRINVNFLIVPSVAIPMMSLASIRILFVSRAIAVVPMENGAAALGMGRHSLAVVDISRADLGNHVQRSLESLDTSKSIEISNRTSESIYFDENTCYQGGRALNF